jgi:cytochrome c-type biogenesis protein CcmH
MKIRTRSLLAGAVMLACAFTAWSQMPTRNQKVAVARVGARLACMCGCADTVATCSMLGCGFSTPARQKITRMQLAGATDQQIIDDFIKENGSRIYRGAPSSFGWIVPYVVLAMGGVFLVWLVRRYRMRPAAEMPEVDPKLARYNDQIEKELASLD